MKSIEEKVPHIDSIHPLLLKRWSARSFSEKMIVQEDLNTLLEAASWAASSMNEQPWRYLYAFRGEPAFDRFWNCLMDGNKPWAKNASVLMLSLANKHMVKNGADNRHYLYDTGAANTNLLLQAAEMDIYGHQMGGFHMDKALSEFALDDNWEPAVFIALGYLDDPEKLEEPFLTREISSRTRRPLNEFTEHVK